MRILTVSDKVEPVLYGPHIRERVGRIDAVLACGDVPHYYLEYIIGLLDAPLYYVHGNHDRLDQSEKPPREAADGREVVYEAQPSLSWATDMHCRTVEYRGLLLAGLDGCRVYNPGAPFQYSEADVRWQAFRLGFLLYLNWLRYGRALDIFITHAPARGIHDGADLAHQGFNSYLELLRRFHPLLMVHGHQHLYGADQARETDYARTRIINTYGYRVIELTQRANGDGWELVSSRR